MNAAAKATVQPRRPKSIALVDLSYMFKKRFHTIPLGERNAAAKATLQDLDKLRRGVEHVIICRDSQRPYLREQLFDKYKANRPEMEPEERAQRRFLYDAIQREGYNLAWCQGHEADDVIATLAREYSEWCDDVRIVGPDKDMGQCVNDRVIQYIPPHGNRDWEIRDAKAVEEKFKVPPSRMALYQALTGDDTDNIPGVKGIGPVSAAKIVNAKHSVEAIAEWMAADLSSGRGTAEAKKLSMNWEQFVMSYKLTVLDSHVPVDSEALLMPRERAPEKQRVNNMSIDVELDGFMGNGTPQPEAAPPEDQPASELSEVWKRARTVYDARFVQANDTKPLEPSAAKDGELLEKEYDRERSNEGEHDPVSNAPGDKGAERVQAPPRRSGTTALATTPVATQHAKYGMVTANLQPVDLTAAYTVSEWIMRSELYPQFKSEAQVFVVIARGKELGLGMMTALAGHHVIDGKPTLSADLIRALAERDANYEYLYPIEFSPTRVVWRGKNKKHPGHVDFPYTIEDAQRAGLCGAGSYGNKGNWAKRPQDMLMKTAGSKLARLLWPAATLGLYCPEELGHIEEELDLKEAA